MNRSVSYLVKILLCLLPAWVFSVRNLRFASPLQSLTIWDPECNEPFTGDDEKQQLLTARGRFLPKFRAGLEAEIKARKTLSEERNVQLQAKAKESDWADMAAAVDERRRTWQERRLERAFDEAAAQVESSQKQLLAKSAEKKNPNRYQFVGVIQPSPSSSPITWYARKKPRKAKWSVRLVHLNRDAIVKDLFDSGKVDIFAKYENSGKFDAETNLPVITGKYSVKPRSWRNLWNFSPINMFTDSSGMYWRERRLRPGLYTDGKQVYEASYRYRDGRNGMHRFSTYQKFLNSKAVDAKRKERIQKRLKEDAPDVVLEL